jgi:hypothetical protein
VVVAADHLAQSRFTLVVSVGLYTPIVWSSDYVVGRAMAALCGRIRRRHFRRVVQWLRDMATHLR